MPRSTIIVKNFSGGLSNHGSAKDIQDKELYKANNVMVSTEGLITMPGGPEGVATPDWSSIFADLTSGTVVKGYGLFTFSADKTSTGGLTGTNYIVLGSKTTDNIKSVVVAESDGTKWSSTSGSTPISLTTGTSTKNYMPVFYFVNDGLRVCDGNLDDTATSRQGLFYIKHKVFRIYNSTVDFGNYDGWYSTACDISAPTQGLYSDDGTSILTGKCTGSTDGTTLLKVTSASHFAGFSSILANYYAYNSVDHKIAKIVSATDQVITTNSTASLSWDDDDRYWLVTAPGAGFVVQLQDIASTGASWTTGEYDIAGTFIYDGSQESPLYQFVSTKAFTITTLCKLRSQLWFHGPYPKRITGARAYIKKRNTGDSWSLIADVNFTKEEISGRASLDLPFSARNASIYANESIFKSGAGGWTFIELETPNVDTFESISGIPFETTTMDVLYKTVVVNKNISYIGNVKIADKIYEDSIFKSHVNGHDMFYNTRRLDVATGDGEAIVALYTFADRLLEFKEKTMYIINVEDVEYVEDVHFYKGINYPHQAVETEYGIAWLNDYGVYLYNGERVIDLFLDPEIQGRRRINLSYYRTFLGTTPTITYDGREKRLLIISDTTGLTSTSPSILIYDMLDNSWVRWDSTSGNHTFSSGTHVFTNFVTDWDRYPSVIDTADLTMTQWISSNASTSNSVLIETKDFDFGEPGLKKNIHRIYLNYRGTNLKAYYKVNGDTAIYNLYTTTSSTQIILPTASSYTTVRLVPSDAIDAKNLYSIQLGIKPSSGSTVTNLGIGDITFIGRVKGKR